MHNFFFINNKMQNISHALKQINEKKITDLLKLDLEVTDVKGIW